MGCIQSTQRHSSPVAQPSTSSNRDVRQPSQQSTDETFLTTRSQWQAFQSIQTLHQKANALRLQIGEERVETGESLRCVHEGAITLFNDLQERIKFIEGDSPTRYQTRLAEIQQDFNAISSIGSHSERYFDRQSSQTYVSNPPSDAV